MKTKKTKTNKKNVAQKTQKKQKAQKKKVSAPSKKLSALSVTRKKYYEAVGRRKTAIARIRLFTSSPSESVIGGNLVINDKPYKDFFPILELQNIVESPLMRLKSLNRFKVVARVKGGGIRAQADAIRHGMSRALVLFDANFRKKLKKAGYLTRDPRKKERKKFGLKKARRAPQWSKR